MLARARRRAGSTGVDGGRDIGTEREPRPRAALIAVREEVPFGTRCVLRFESYAAAHRRIVQFPYRLTSRAARLVAECPGGGTAQHLAELLLSGRLRLIEAAEKRIRHGGAARGSAAAAPVEALPPTLQATSWIKFKIVHHRTGEPFVGVRLTLRTPSGAEAECRTNAGGVATLDDIAPGVCDVWCPLEGARLKRTVAFVGMGEPEPSEKAVPFRAAWGAKAEWIAHIVEHKVQSGETLKSVAEQYSYRWQELAEFNWGTSTPDRINQHLKSDVGCTAKTRDGMNYQFTSEDDPGLIYVPKPWSQNGLATEQTHVIRVRIAAGFRLILENMEKLRIPRAEYEATFSDGSVRKGRLGGGGVALIKDPPPGPVQVRYPDLDDIEAKSLAAAARKALDDRNPLEIHRLFRYPPETVRRAFQAYDRYFNDYHGEGLRNDLKREFFSDPDAELIFFGYLARVNQVEQSEAASTDVATPVAARAEEPVHA
jgi:LysM domain